MSLGPNEKKLIAHRAALLAVPDGGGSRNAIDVITNKDKLSSVLKQATEWVKEAIDAVLAAPDNYLADREAVAAAILERIEQRNLERIEQRKKERGQCP